MEHVNLFLELMRQKNGTIGVKEFLDFNKFKYTLLLDQTEIDIKRINDNIKVDSIPEY